MATTVLVHIVETLYDSRLSLQILIKLVRRYKYLEKMFEEEMKKVLVFIKGFQPIERVKLARMTALWIASGAVPPTVLAVLNNEHLIKDGVALEFLLELFVTLKQERGIPALITALKKGSLESRLMEFLPLNRRSEEHLKNTFNERGLEDIVKLHKAQASQEHKRELQSVSTRDFIVRFVAQCTWQKLQMLITTNLKTLNVCDIKLAATWLLICLLAVRLTP